MNAAICSRGTGSLGLYVVDDVPLVNPEKNASPIEQKKILEDGTSVNGSAMLAPPQAPVSARSFADSTINVVTNPKSKIRRIIGPR
jgi:hypothetical protein